MVFFFEVSQLIEGKGKALAGKIDTVAVRAGVDRLDLFGYLNTLDSLAGGNVLLYDEIRNLPYSVYFAKLLLNKEVSEYQERYRKILQDK